MLVLSQESIRRLAVTVPDVVVQLLLNLATILSHRLHATTDEWLTALKAEGMNTLVDAP